MHVLILGGTTEARRLAAVLAEDPALRVTSSLAGRVAEPRLPAGEPMVFFVQLCFADSRDLVGELPGDVLLIFTSDEHGHTTDGLHYEWYPLGIEGLVTVDDIPDTPWRAAPCQASTSLWAISGTAPPKAAAFAFSLIWFLMRTAAAARAPAP